LYKLDEKPKNEVDRSKPIGIKLENASFGWKRGEKETISNVNLEVRPGELSIVIGTVGSGKSTLLHSIMRENNHMKGECSVNGTMAYVEQEPFIYSASVTENITLGRPYDAKRFAFAVEMSQLDKDLQLMSNGTNTIIGERGINISGG
jgi:ABC-type bacteriocin/lantibiotic exporter with double-glycine peptidase domain